MYNTWIAARYDSQRMFFMLPQMLTCGLKTLKEVTIRNCWSGLQGSEIWLSWNYNAIGPLWPDLFVLLDFSILFHWRGHDVISDLRPPNKIMDMHAAIAHGLTPHSKFESHHLKTVWSAEGQIRTSVLKLPLLILEIVWPAPHTLVDYPLLPTCQPKLMVTHASMQKEKACA